MKRLERVEYNVLDVIVCWNRRAVRGLFEMKSSWDGSWISDRGGWFATSSVGSLKFCKAESSI